MGGQGCRDQPISRMPARTSTNHKRPLFVEESAPHSMQPIRKGGSCSPGFPQFNSLDKNNPQPPFPSEITAHRKSVPKPRVGGPTQHQAGHILPQPGVS